MKDCIHTALKAARALNTVMEMTFRLTDDDLGLQSGKRIIIAFNPKDLVEAQKVETLTATGSAKNLQSKDIGPGTCVRVRYEDNGNIKQFYIKRSPEDRFLDDDTIDLPSGSPLAQSLAEGVSGGMVTLSLPDGTTRSITILEFWEV